MYWCLVVSMLIYAYGIQYTKITRWRSIGNITWHTNFKCKQHTMYLIYALKFILCVCVSLSSLSLSLSLSLYVSRALPFFSLLDTIYLWPTVVYLLYIHFASPIIKSLKFVLPTTVTNKATFRVMLLYVRNFSVSYNTCSCTLHLFKVFVQPTVWYLLCA